MMGARGATILQRARTHTQAGCVWCARAQGARRARRPVWRSCWARWPLPSVSPNRRRSEWTSEGRGGGQMARRAPPAPANRRRQANAHTQTRGQAGAPTVRPARVAFGVWRAILFATSRRPAWLARWLAGGRRQAPGARLYFTWLAVGPAGPVARQLSNTPTGFSFWLGAPSSPAHTCCAAGHCGGAIAQRARRIQCRNNWPAAGRQLARRASGRPAGGDPIDWRRQIICLAGARARTCGARAARALAAAPVRPANAHAHTHTHTQVRPPLAPAAPRQPAGQPGGASISCAPTPPARAPNLIARQRQRARPAAQTPLAHTLLP